MSVFISTRKRRIITAFVIAALFAGMVHFTTPRLTAEEQVILDNIIVSSETFSDSILGFDLTNDEVVIPEQGDVTGNTSGVADSTDNTYVNSNSVSYSSTQFLSYNSNTGVYSVDLSASRAAKYIDRLAISEEYRTFYNNLIEASDNDGYNDYLIDASNSNARIAGDSDASYGIPIITHSFADATADSIEAQIDATTAAVNKIARAVYDAFDRDHPEVFWLSGDTKIKKITTMTTSASGLCRADVRYYLVTSEGSFDIRSTKYRDVSAIRNDISNLNSSVNSIITSLTGADLGTKVAQIDQLLCANNTYNNAAAMSGSKSYPRAYESISGLVYHNGNDGPVCEGYARGFKVVCDRLGIPCILSSGMANDGSGADNHMWNLVQINGAWYGVDSTWNDKGSSSSKQYTLKGSSSFLNHRTVRNDVSQGGVYFTNEPYMSANNYALNDASSAQSDTPSVNNSNDNNQNQLELSQVGNLSAQEFILSDNQQVGAITGFSLEGVTNVGQIYNAQIGNIPAIPTNPDWTINLPPPTSSSYYLAAFTGYAVPRSVIEGATGATTGMTVIDNATNLPITAGLQIEYYWEDNTDATKWGTGLPSQPGVYKITLIAKDTSTSVVKGGKIVYLRIDYPYFDISKVTYNGSFQKLDYYSEDIKIGASGYTVSTNVNGPFDLFAYLNGPATGTVANNPYSNVFYFKDNVTGTISAPQYLSANFDKIAPKGSITLGTKAWQQWISNWTRGRYKVVQNEIIIEGVDEANGSGVNEIWYFIDTTGTRYVSGASIPMASWQVYNIHGSNRPALNYNLTDSVIYAKIKDRAGNITYINSDGMVLDTIPPTISNIAVAPSVASTVAGATAPSGPNNMMVTFDMDQTGSYYYMILPSTYTPPDSAATVVATYNYSLPGAIGGTRRTDYSAVGAGTVNTPGAVTFFIDGLTEGADYRIYLVGCDDVMTDISTSRTRNDAVNVSTIYPSELFKYSSNGSGSPSYNKLEWGGTKVVNEKCNVGKTGTYDLTKILPPGAVIGTPVISADGFRIFSDTPKLAGNILSYTLYPDANNNGKTGVIRIPITSSTSYNPYNIELYVTATNLNYNMIKEEGISYVPSGLASIYSTTENLVYNLKSRLAMKDNSISANDMKIYNITLLCTGTDGIQHVATAADFPSSGLVVTLAYPTGTSRTGTNFTVAHMFEEDVNGYKAGDIEFPTVTNTENGIQFVVHGLSPIIVGWRGIGGGINYQELQPADSVTIQNNDPTVTYALSKVEGFINVPSSLKALYADAAIFNKALTSTVMAKNPAINANNIKVYDVKLCTIDAKGNKKQVTYDKIPNGGVLVTLAYPPGTSKDGYTFTVAHMFEETYGGHKPGDVEFLSVTNASYGMQFRVTSLSPIIVGWVYTGTNSTNIPNPNNGTTTVIAGNGTNTNKPTGNRVSPATGELFPWDKSILEK